jgi:polysaccharide biosynthesis/export protein
MVFMTPRILISIAVFLSTARGAPQVIRQTHAAAVLSQQDEYALPAKPKPLAGDSHDAGSIHSRDAEMRIGGGDLLEISLFGTDFSCGHDKEGCEARVSTSGSIVLPLIGEVEVGGLTVAKAAEAIAARLTEGRFFNNPQVTIIQKEYASQGIAILGEVQRPGNYPLVGSHTLLQAISAAGGTTLKAGNDAMIIHTDNPNQPQHADLSSLVGGSTQLIPGDTVVVSKAGIVYVVGDVRQPSGIAMERSGLTILKAIAMAQGTNPTASSKNATLIRNTQRGREEIRVSLREIISNKAPDLELQPEDILFIPSSLTKSATRRSVEAIVQAATGVAIFGRY